MPQVPLSSATIQTSQARQNLQASPDAFGAAQARGLAAAGEGLMAVGRAADERAQAIERRALEIQQTNDAADAAAAYDLADGQVRELLRGDNGYLALNGIDPETSYDNYSEQLKKIGDDIVADMSPGARTAFESLWGPRRRSVLNKMTAHKFDEREAYNQNAFKGMSVSAATTAVENRTDPEAYSESIARGVGAIRAANVGQSAQAIGAAIEAYKSQTGLTAISAAVDTNDIETAQRLLNTVELTGVDRANAVELIDRATIGQRSQEVATEMYGTHGDDVRKATIAIRDQFEGDQDLQDQAVSRYKTLVSERKVEKVQNTEAVFDQAFGLVSQGVPPDELPPSVYMALSDESRKYLRATYERGQGLATTTNFSYYEDKISLQGRDLAEVDLTEARSQLAEDDYRRLESKVLNERNRRPDPAIGTNTVINALMDEQGIEDKDERGRFRLRATTLLEQAEAEKGAPLTNEEEQDVMNGLAKEVRVTRPGLFNDKTTIVGLVEFDDILPEHRNIVTELVFDGQLDEREVEKAYQAVMSRSVEEGKLIPPNRVGEFVRAQMEKNRVEN